MAGVNPYSVEWFTLGYRNPMVAHIVRVRHMARPALHSHQRRILADRQYQPVLGPVAGQNLDTVCSSRSRSRIHALVLVRPHISPGFPCQLVVCPAGNHSAIDRLICLRVRSRYKNFFIEERGK